MSYLPLSFQLDAGPVLLVGGGTIALQKARVLHAAGARLRVVAPAILADLAALPGVELHRRPFRDDDVQGALLVISATDDAAINRAVWQAARAARVPVNVVDDPPLCDFIFPSILRRGGMTLAVSTGGAGPALARQLREALEDEFDADYGEVLEALRRLRREARRRLACPGARRAAIELMAWHALQLRGHADAHYETRMLALLDELGAIDAREQRRPHPLEHAA